MPVLILLALLCLSLPAAADGLVAQVAPVRMESGYTVNEEYAGRVVGRRASAVGFDQGGLLTEVLVDEGQRVERGAVLARLDRRRFEAKRRELAAKLDRERAGLGEIKARLALARANAKRQKGLKRSAALNRQRFDEALYEAQALESQLRAAGASVRQVEAAIDAVDVDLSLAILEAPFAGMVVERLADEGAALGAGEAVLRILEDSHLEAKVGVPVKAAAGLEPGRRYFIRFNGSGAEATLRAVLPEIDPRTRTVSAVFDLDPGSAARAGQLARLTLGHRIEASGLWLPTTALTESRRGLWSVLVAEETPEGGHVLSRRELQMLHAEAERAYVRGTLREGEKVVVTGTHRLVPGQMVRISQ